MKILFAIKAMNDISGGAERVLADVSNGLAVRGHDVRLLTFDATEGNSFYPLNPAISRIDLGIGKTRHKTGIAEIYQRIKAIRKSVIIENPDIVVAFMPSMFVPLSFALTRLNIPIIASEHIVPKHYNKRPLQFALIAASLTFMTRMTVLTESMRQMYPRIFRRKQIVIPNPVAHENEHAPPDHPNSNGRYVILNIGRLSHQKDQKTLIRAFAKIADKHPNWDVHIYGEGHDRPILEEVIRQERLEDRVYLMGTTRNVHDVYMNANMLAMPSRYEGLPLAPAEAMSRGLPVIAFRDCPGLSEMITHDVNGILVDKGEDKRAHFAYAMADMMQYADKRKRLGENAISALEHLAPERILDEWERLLKSTAIET